MKAITLKHAHDAYHRGLNQTIAIALNNRVGSMLCAYFFCLIAGVGLLAILGILPAIVALLVAWASQSFIQLVMLPVIMVSQNVLGKHAELQSEETARAVQQLLSDVADIKAHLAQQHVDAMAQRLSAEVRKQQGKRQ